MAVLRFSSWVWDMRTTIITQVRSEISLSGSTTQHDGPSQDTILTFKKKSRGVPRRQLPLKLKIWKRSRFWCQHPLGLRTLQAQALSGSPQPLMDGVGTGETPSPSTLLEGFCWR